MDGYTLLQRQGSGSYATVWKARRRVDGRVVAIKQLKAVGLSWEEVLALPEVAHWKDLHHPNVLQLDAVVRLRGVTYLIMDFCDANLYQVMTQAVSSGRGGFSEAEVRWVMQSLLQGLAYCHSMGIMHRDVKPENVLLCFPPSSEGTPAAKLCDFGQATRTSPSGKLTDYVATRWYRAPELLLHAARYDGAVDVYAAGVVMAELFTMRPIFPGTSEADQLFRIASVMGTFTQGDWPQGPALAAAMGHALPPLAKTGIATMLPRGVSSSACAVIEAMLTWNPARRPTAAHVLSMPFFKEGPATPPRPVMGSMGRGGEDAVARAEAECANAEIAALLAEGAAAGASVPAHSAGTTAPTSTPTGGDGGVSSNGSHRDAGVGVGGRTPPDPVVPAPTITTGRATLPPCITVGEARPQATGRASPASSASSSSSAALGTASSGAASADGGRPRRRAAPHNPLAALMSETPASLDPTNTLAAIANAPLPKPVAGLQVGGSGSDPTGHGSVSAPSPAFLPSLAPVAAHDVSSSPHATGGIAATMRIVQPSSTAPLAGRRAALPLTATGHSAPPPRPEPASTPSSGVGMTHGMAAVWLGDGGGDEEESSGGYVPSIAHSATSSGGSGSVKGDGVGIGGPLHTCSGGRGGADAGGGLSSLLGPRVGGGDGGPRPHRPKPVYGPP